MCLGGSPPAPSAPPPLPPPPPAPLPPVQPVDPPDPVIKDLNTQVKRAKDDRGNKARNQYSRGTGSLRIKLNPKLNTGEDKPSGGINTPS